LRKAGVRGGAELRWALSLMAEAEYKILRRELEIFTLLHG
jgi:hypothetical protein